MTLQISASLLVLLQSAPGGGLTALMFQFAAIFVIFYLLIIRPQQKQRKSHEEALRNLKRGDRIVTSGGIVAEVIHIKESVKDGTPTRSMDDEITIKSGESRLIVERGRIGKILTVTGQTSEAPKEAQKGGRPGS